MDRPRRISDLFWSAILPNKALLPEKTLRAGEFLAVTQVVLLFGAILLLPLPLGETLRRSLILGGFIATCICSLVLLRLGKVMFTGAFTVTGNWAVLTYACVTGGGVFAPAFSGYIFINLILGLIFGVRGAIFAFGLTFVTGVSLVLLQTGGYLPPSAYPVTVQWVWAVNTVLQFIGTALVIVVVRMFTLSAERADRELAERKKVEKDSQAIEAKFRSLVQNSYDLMTIHDQRGNIIYASPSTLRVLGFSPDQLIGKHPAELIHPQDAEAALEDLRELLLGENDGEPTVFRLLRSDGREVWLESVGTNHLNDPEIRGVIVNSRDITRRHAAEEALRQNENLFRLIFEHSPVGIALFSPDGGILRANARLCLLLGYSEKELQATTIYEVTHPDDREMSHQFARKLAGPDDRPLLIQKRYCAKDGTVIWGEGVSSAVRNVRGEVLYFIAHIQDVGARRKTEIALRESEARFRNLAEAAFEGIVVGHHGRVVDANTQMASLLGLELQDLIGKRVSDFVPPESIDLVMSAIKEERESPYEHLVQRANGEIRMVEARGKALPIGGHSMRVTAVRDITERKQIEERLRASLKEKEVLLKEVHHRVKNNLQVVNSMLNLQSSTIQDQEMKSLFQESQGRIRSMALIHESLYRSTDLAAVPFGGYCRILLDQLMRTYALYDVQATHDIQDFALGIDQAIPVGLILNELVTNALKHAFPHGGKGHIDLTVHVDDGICTIRVEDDGVGLPMEFDAKTGSSLGMQLVTTLCEQIDGKLDWSSSRGTTFTVSFHTQ